MIETKGAIRKRLLQIRSVQDIHDVTLKSQTIINRLFEVAEFNKSQVICVYLDFKNEVKTHDFVRISLNKCKSILVPFISEKNGTKEIEASYIRDLNSELISGMFGIDEPKPENRISVNPETIELIVVPGIAFAEDGNRVGFGQGFYDCFLSKLKHSCIKVGLCFDFQLLKNISTKPHDVPMDMIITETRIILTNNKHKRNHSS